MKTMGLVKIDDNLMKQVMQELLKYVKLSEHHG